MARSPETATGRLAARMAAVAPSPMLALAGLAATLKAEGRDIIGLATGEPDFDTPAHIQDAAVAAMRAGDTHYTPSDGTRALKDAVRRKFARENGLDYGPDEVSVGAGAKQVIFNAFAATIDPLDGVVFAAPYYPSYLEMVRFFGGVPVEIATRREDGFKLSPDRLADAIDERTRWVVLNSPSNPTGAAYAADELAALADVLLRHPGVWVLADDIYEHLLFDERPFATIAAVEPRLAGRTLTVNGVSKSFCMTGWRIGYGGGPAPLIEAMATVQSQTISCPSSISQAAACAALDGPLDVVRELRRVFRDRRDRVVRALGQAPGVNCPTPDGAFYVFPSCEDLIGKGRPDGRTIATDGDYARYLLDGAGVVVVPGTVFGAPGHFRLSFAADTGLLAEACRRIVEANRRLA